MKVNELIGLIDGKLLTCGGGENEITCAHTCDLLSWVMAKGQEGCAWVTVQTHLNVIAVASLHDMACVVLPENIQMDKTVLDKADEEGIGVIVSPLSAYSICGVLHDNKIADAEK